MASLKAKIGWEKEKTSIIVQFRIDLTRSRKFQENCTKIQKTKKYHYSIISSQNKVEKGEK